MQDKILARILRDLGEPGLRERLAALPFPDLNTLLMAIYADKTAEITPAALLQGYRRNPYVRPSPADPEAFHRMEAELLCAGREAGFAPVLLSPAAPLGCCSALAPVSQNKILPSLRHAEILSDPTNVLALRAVEQGGTGHYCTTHRALRVMPGFSGDILPHFGLFCALSYGRDTGSYSFEKEALGRHLTLYRRLLDGPCVISLRARPGYTDSAGFLQAMRQVCQEVWGADAVEMAEATDSAYYQGVNFKIYRIDGESRQELGDGGFVDWGRKLAGNAKTRMCISAMGMERLRAK